MGAILEYFLPVLLLLGSFVGISSLFNGLPLLPSIDDTLRSRRISAYLRRRYGLVLTKQQVLKLAQGKRVSYEGTYGEEFIALLRPNTELGTRELVRLVRVEKGAKTGPVLEQQPYPEATSWPGSIGQLPQQAPKEATAKKAKPKSAAQGAAGELMQRVEQLEREVAQAPALPSFFQPLATDIFELLKEMLPELDTALYSTEQQYTLEATASEYLPTLIGNAVKLPKSFFRANANLATASAIESQLRLIKQALTSIHDAKYESAVRVIEQQGYFLNEKFEHPPKTLEISTD